jgi:hypothetical protein
MAQNRAKTTRVIARMRASELAEKLQVSRSLVYTRMHQLGIKPRYGFGKQVFFSPAQAKLIADSIHPAGSGSDVDLNADRAKLLIGALEKGSTKIQLVVVHGASPAESDSAWTWWHEQRRSMVLSSEEIELLESRVGKFEAGGHLASLIDEAIFAARTCDNCGAGITSPLCRACCNPRKVAMRNPEDKPRTPAVVVDEEFEQRMQKLQDTFNTDPDGTPTSPETTTSST